MDHLNRYEQIIASVRNYVEVLFNDDTSGHDYFHMKRVATMAKKIARFSFVK